MKFKISLLVALATLMTFIGFSQSDSQKPTELVAQSKTSSSTFQNVDLFKIDMSTSKAAAGIENNIEDYNLFDIDNENLQKILRDAPATLTLEIPVNFKNSFEIELVAVDIFSYDFTVVQRSDNSVVDVEHGLHYRGIVKGDDNSIAAISIFGDEVMGLISSDDGNIVIGKLQNQVKKNKHIIYDDFDVITDLGLDCGTIDDGIGYKRKDLEFDDETKDVGDCVRLYMEVDKDIHDNKGGVTGATNYVTGLMNQVITLYANENVAAVVSQIVVWNVTSPYSSSSSSGMLSDFQANISSINGTLGQLLSYQASGGIAAGFNGICNSNVDNSLSFSSISSSYSTVPTYSWSVMVVTHEFGHLWGSRHTHACVWNGNNTAIDGCSGSTEGSCALPGNPSQGGTLMSYCHLQSVGINFNEGFGPQPGNVIRNSVANSNCTAPCGPPTCDDNIQNGNETGVDCGGPDCPACPTCDDGIQNGEETGVDCGGPDCAPCPCFDNGVTLTILLDNYPEETSWEIKSGSTILASGGTYGSQPDGSTVVEVACLPDGCYDFVIYDSYGDGICCSYGVGNYQLVADSDGSVLASGGAFGSSETTNFCVTGTPPVMGCTDPNAHNYDPNAEVDDGSCETCSDGIQNGDETGVDCGGSNCAPCPIPGCTDPNAHNYNPNANQDDGSCETCSDGIQNGDETDVDCGGALCGPCPIPGCTDPNAHNYNPNANQDDGSCETCSDGVQNGDETDVDCGGALCAPCNNPVPGCTDPNAHNYNPSANQDDGSCETCTDGVQNGDETGVDCGGALCGPCPIPGCTDPNAHNYNPNANQDDGSCETCSDGVQNGDETGVDCGGALCAPCSGGCTYEVINFNDFNSSWGIWNDGGSDCRRSQRDADYSVDGIGRPVRLRDNTSTSTTTTDNLNLSGYSELSINFTYIAVSMDNSSEDFWLQISTDGGSTFTTVEEWNEGDEFVNDVRYWETVVIPGPFTANTQLRFRCDASGNSDWVFIDNVEISGCPSGSGLAELGAGNNNEEEITNTVKENINDLNLFPNPARDLLTVTFEVAKEDDVQLVVTDFRGKLVNQRVVKAAKGKVESRVDVSAFSSGMYVVHVITTDGQHLTKKFIVID